MTPESMTASMDLTTRIAQEDEKDFVYALNRTVYRDVVIQQFGDWDESGQQQYFEEKWTRVVYRIIEYNGTPIGVFSMTEHPQEHVIHEIQLLPAFQGRGIGSTLIHQKIVRAHAQHVPLRLRVLIHNVRAQQLYARLGFVTSETTDTYMYMEYPG